MAYPSVLSSLTNPQPTDRLNSPSHSAIETAQNTAILEVERALGTDASVLGTIIGDLRNPSSGGGGHVQSANKGGTGQTSYNKGDILVGQSSSVLSKLAIGPDGYIPQANSSVASGINWVPGQTNKIATSASVVVLLNSSNETSVMSASVPGSVLGSGNALRANLFVRHLQSNGLGNSLTFKGIYGNSSVGTIIVSSIATSASIMGMVSLDIIANASPSVQSGIVRTDLFPPLPINPTSSFVGMKRMSTAPITEDSGAAKNIGITAKWNTASNDNDLEILGYTIEKII